MHSPANFLYPQKKIETGHAAYSDITLLLYLYVDSENSGYPLSFDQISWIVQLPAPMPFQRVPPHKPGRHLEVHRSKYH